MAPIPLFPRMLAVLGVVLMGALPTIVAGVLWLGRADRTAPTQELERLLRGRQSVLDALARHGPLDFAALHERLRPPPGPGSLADWLVSMVADGNLHATIDREGRALFVRTPPSRLEPLPRVTIGVAPGGRGVDRCEEAPFEDLPEESAGPVR